MITLKELQDEWAVDCKINELELGKETIKTAELHSKYLNHLSNFKLQSINFAASNSNTGEVNYQNKNSMRSVGING
jgi:hypothetical protein